MSDPIAALAIVLAITMRARSSAKGGRSLTFVLVTNCAKFRAILIASASLINKKKRCADVITPSSTPRCIGLHQPQCGR